MDLLSYLLGKKAGGGSGEGSMIEYKTEEQEIGTWIDGHAHYHVLLRFDDFEKIFISNKDLNDFWSKGFVRVNKLKEVDNIGAYVSAYLADLDISNDDAEALHTAGFDSGVIEKDGKNYIKGGRVSFYPTGVQIYNKSKGLIFPDREKMSYKKAQKKVGKGIPTYEKNIFIETEDFSNRLRFEAYNSKRL